MALLAICVYTMFSIFSATSFAADWPSWRGPMQNGVSLESDLPDSPNDVLWRAPYGGRSTPVILGGRIFAIDRAGQGVMEQERVFSLDLKTGQPLWEHRFNVFHTDIPSARVGWASVVADPETGNIYAYGVEGMFFCFDRDGHVLWSRSLTETFGRISGYGGRTTTPVVDEDRVIVSFLNSSFGPQAKGAHRYLAMDKRTGEVLWWSTPGGKPEDTTYSVPVVAVIGGRRLLIDGNADGSIYAMKARTGERVWGFQLSKRGINSSVVVQGDRVYATHSEENLDSTEMGRVVCIDARGSGDVTKTHEVWRRDGIEAGYASPLLHGGRLYVMSNFGILYCFDAATGKEIWKYVVGRVGKGSPVWADGKIYVPTVTANFAILEDAGKEARPRGHLKFTSTEGGVVSLFGSPAVSDGHVVFFTSEEMVCLARKDAAGHPVVAHPAVVPPLPPETPVSAGAQPAAIQVRPAEVLLKPGQKAKFRAVAFDEAGHSLGPVTVQWSYKPASGAVDAQGGLTAPGPGGSIGAVAARYGKLAAAARVRVVPELPIAEDFESYGAGKLPGWWIGVSKAKYALDTLGGSKVLKKLADARGPIFNRSRVYITPPIATGYTVEADVMGVKEGRRRGDVGLINARYRLELFGQLQRLRMLSWVPGPRFVKQVHFAWEPGRWYRMKFRVGLKDGQALVKAKVWPRGQDEPAAWTLEGTDPQPNLEGSAGLYAFSMAPLYFDNVRIER